MAWSRGNIIVSQLLAEERREEISNDTNMLSMTLNLLVLLINLTVFKIDETVNIILRPFLWIRQLQRLVFKYTLHDAD